MAHEPSSSSPANLSDSGLDNGSDLGNKCISDGIISGFGYSQGNNGSEQLSIDRNNPNIGIKTSDVDSEEEGGKVKFLCSYNGKIMPRPSDGI